MPAKCLPIQSSLASQTQPTPAIRAGVVWVWLARLLYNPGHALARTFRRGFTCLRDLGISMQYQGGLGACSPRKFRCSESASESILAQKQSRSSYHGSQSTASKFWLSTYAFSKPSNFHERRYTTNVGRTAGRATSLEGQLPSA